MLIFDFPDTSNGAIEAALDSIRRGLKVAFKYYPFLTGQLGPLKSHSRQNLVQLRYGDAAASGEISPEIFLWSIHKEDLFYNYQKLCASGMPVSHWEMEDFCVAPTQVDPREWPQAFTLQANFLEDGALVLCFAFLHTIADGASILQFFEMFAAGCGSEILPNEMSGEHLTDTYYF
ncbi:hypothetical protein F4779DRAFT_571321 [Xylariaceae sp. FL0662B]|nr:hypothetical protein F4779DRAFT_571321 [Xylariaceae sp. FL0662B]